LCSLTLNGAGLDDPFAVVFIDHKTEETYGGFPLDRAILAKGIREIKKHKPRGIIIKFFLDLPKDPASDRALAESFDGVPVVLEARLEDSVAKPNPLPVRFVLRTPLARRNTALLGRSGWLPLEIFSAKAADIGFVDFYVPEKVPIIEQYQGAAVKSLYLCAVELALGQTAEVFPGKRLVIGKQEVALTEESELSVTMPVKDELDYTPFHAVVDGKVKLSFFENKVVILGYDGTNIHSINTSLGKIKAHRFFCYGLASLYRRVKG
jgi:hypothetical protein